MEKEQQVTVQDIADEREHVRRIGAIVARADFLERIRRRRNGEIILQLLRQAHSGIQPLFRKRLPPT